MIGQQADGTLRVERLEPVKDLGWANGWTSEPDIVTQCRADKHYQQSFFKVESDYRRCITRTTCSVCNYTYRVDSSD